MKPEQFFLANSTVGVPSRTGKDEFDALPIFTDGTHCLSRWKMSWRERLSALFSGTVWVWMKSGKTMPPMTIQASRNAQDILR